LDHEFELSKFEIKNNTLKNIGLSRKFFIGLRLFCFEIMAFKK